MKNENFERATQIKKLIEAAKINITNINDMRSDATKPVICYACPSWRSIDFYNDFFNQEDFIDVYLLKAEKYIKKLEKEFESL